MPKKEGWSRMQDREDASEYYYIWRNDKGYKTEIRIRDNAFGTYLIELRLVGDHMNWDFYEVEGFNSKKIAKSYALKIQEKNTKVDRGIYLRNLIRNGRKGFEEKSVESISAPWDHFDDDSLYTYDK